MDRISRAALAALLKEAAEAHHEAYAVSNGIDPEWASWYAPYLQASIGAGLGQALARSEIIYLLIKAERDQVAAGDTSAWPDYYAGVFLES
jgi:NAD(P)H-hydrate epimerase